MLLVRRSAGPSVRASKLGDEDAEEDEEGRAAETEGQAVTQKEEGCFAACWEDDAGDGKEGDVEEVSAETPSR